MCTVWKYDIPLMPGEFTLDLPLNSLPLYIAEQDAFLRLWVEVDPSASVVPVRFLRVGTGHPMEHSSEQRRYVGSCLAHGGALVWHLFEIVG